MRPKAVMWCPTRPCGVLRGPVVPYAALWRPHGGPVVPYAALWLR